MTSLRTTNKRAKKKVLRPYQWSSVRVALRQAELTRQFYAAEFGAQVFREIAQKAGILDTRSSELFASGGIALAEPESFVLPIIEGEEFDRRMARRPGPFITVRNEITRFPEPNEDPETVKKLQEHLRRQMADALGVPSRMIR